MEHFNDDIKNLILFNKRKAAQEKSEMIYKESSKKRLMDNISKKFKTTMIGAIARYEAAFGELWGQDTDNPSEEQQELRRVWEEVRTDILNNGNSQLRAALEEIAQYTMSWDKYKTNLIVRKD